MNTKHLINDRYIIEAITNKDHRLTGEKNILSAEGIKPLLKLPEIAENIKVYEEIDSTNREAKAQAVAGAAHGTTILANRQNAGRGRCGKDFFSPHGSGLYMSFVLHSDRLGLDNSTAITAYAAVCVCQAIEAACNIRPAIKWVNDIFVDGKKICGILTEAITEYECSHVREVIVGVGINISTKTEDFPEPLRDIATSLYPEGNASITRNHLAAEIINRIVHYDRLDETLIFAEYKKRLFMLEADIVVLQGDESYCAKALDIDKLGRLIVRNEKGEIKTLFSGEIKI